MGFDTIENNLVFMHGILTVKVKVLQGYIARITELKPSDYWQSTRSTIKPAPARQRQRAHFPELRHLLLLTCHIFTH